MDKVPVLPFGGIKNQRSFVYVGNLCAMIEFCYNAAKKVVFFWRVMMCHFLQRS